jgi:hypothetical protein
MNFSLDELANFSYYDRYNGQAMQDAKSTLFDKLNGKVAVINGVHGTLKHDSYMAKYPREEMVHKLAHYASDIGKKHPHYQETKAKLKDDWMTDVGENPYLLADVMHQTGIK